MMIKQKRHFILTVCVLIFFTAIYQNCGSKSTTATTTGSVQGDPTPSPAPGEPYLSADTAQFAFMAAVGSAPKVFTITNSASAQAMNISISPLFTQGQYFTLSNDTCTGTSLSTNAQCTFSISFKNCTTATPLGRISISYQDNSGLAQAPIPLYVSGMEGHPSAVACMTLNQNIHGAANIAIPGNFQLSTPTPTSTPTIINHNTDSSTAAPRSP